MMYQILPRLSPCPLLSDHPRQLDAASAPGRRAIHRALCHPQVTARRGLFASDGAAIEVWLP
jgi:hypothetical protein